MYLNGKRNRADAQKAIEVLTQAVRLDPQYARAWAGKAHAHRTNLGGSNAQAEYQKSVEAVNRALALDPNLAEAHSVVCDNKMSYEWDFEGAGRECERAIELDPNSSLAHLNYSRYLNAQGRFEAAIDEAKTAIDLEPSSLVSQRHYGTCLYYARRYPEAVKQFERVIAMDKTFGTTYNWIIVALEMQGNHAEAYEWFMKARAVNYPDQKEITEAYQDAYARSGWHGMLLEQIRRTEDSKSETPRPEHKGVMQPPVYFQSAVLYAKVGNKDKAFEDLEKSYQRREMWITLLKVEPGLDSLRSDSRFDGLVKRVGLK
jgi:tetratricopeptide (TPR) repeat protein